MRGLAELPETGTPVLLVMRPTGDDEYDLDGYLRLDVELRRVEIMGVGPLPEPGASSQ
jgi:hypothetical protein